MDEIDREKRAAAEAAAALVEDGMVVGLGTGSTVAYLLPTLGKRRLDISCVATSPATESLARAEGIRVGPFERIDRLDMAIDGADQVDPTGWLIKGGGGAHTREKIVAAAADRFIVIVSSNKLVPRLSPPFRSRSWVSVSIRSSGPCPALICARLLTPPTAGCWPTTRRPR